MMIMIIIIIIVIIIIDEYCYSISELREC